MQVCDRKVSRSQPHSAGTWGRSSPRRLPWITTSPCFPTTTSSGAIGCERGKHADFDLQFGCLLERHRLETGVVESRRPGRLGNRPVERLGREDITDAATQPAMQMQGGKRPAAFGQVLARGGDLEGSARPARRRWTDGRVPTTGGVLREKTPAVRKQ